jgi:hypothetical protein
MSDTPPLQHLENDVLTALSESELIGMMIDGEDQVPRTVIDECARRGGVMVEALREVLAQGRGWAFDEDADIDDAEANLGEWWLLHHAAMILGLMPEESAGLLLADYMRRIDEELDDNLQDWLSGRWPALFRNKPASVLPALRAVCDDPALDSYTRIEALEALLARAELEGASSLDAAIDRAAALAADENEDEECRLLAGNALLSFAAPRHRKLLDTLAAGQSGPVAIFSATEVEEAYAKGGLERAGDRYSDPWAFYTPEQAEERRLRWLDEDEDEDDGADDELDDPHDAMPLPETFVRQGPKLGRNDPCPCGSGKKYKKCCLDKQPH